MRVCERARWVVTEREREREARTREEEEGDLDSVLEDEARRDVHGEELLGEVRRGIVRSRSCARAKERSVTHLEEELAGVGEHELDDPLGRLAPGAPAVVAHEAALLADVDLERVGRHHEALEEELRCAVRDEAVALHLAEAQAAVARATLGRLAGEDGTRTTASRREKRERVKRGSSGRGKICSRERGKGETHRARACILSRTCTKQGGKVSKSTRRMC